MNIQAAAQASSSTYPAEGYHLFHARLELPMSGSATNRRWLGIELANGQRYVVAKLYSCLACVNCTVASAGSVGLHTMAAAAIALESLSTTVERNRTYAAVSAVISEEELVVVSCNVRLLLAVNIS